MTKTTTAVVLERADASLLPRIQVRQAAARAGADRAKRAFDLLAGSVALLVALPMMLLIALALLVTDGPRAGVLFGQERYGRDGQRFRCLKFRTMVPDADAVLADLLDRDPAARRSWETVCKLDDDPRITPLGRLLRRTSLDELPQLLNVLMGNMSLVGPRPLARQHELDWYGPETPTLLSVRPGMTGLWQVSGRSETTSQERVALDLAYVAGASLALDLRILLQTVVVLLRPATSGAR